MRKVLLIIIFLLFIFKAYSRDFVMYNTGNSGISYDSVTQIMQDKRGFIWVGTHKGLNRFDGKHWTNYYKDDLGLKSDFIHVLVEDSDGDVWVGTDNGATRYCFQSDSFVPVGDAISNKVTYMSVGVDGTVWILVNDLGIYSYTAGEGLKERVSYNEFGSSGFRRLLLCRDGSFLMSRYLLKNLYSADANLKDIEEVDMGSSKDFFKGDRIEGLFQGGGDTVYVVSSKKGICYLDLKRKSVSQLYSPPTNTVLRHVYRHSDNSFFLSASAGIWRYDGKTSMQVYEGHSECCFVDKRGGLWIGTKNNGILYRAPDGILFKILNMTCRGKSLRGCICGQMDSGQNGDVWIATEKLGVLHYNNVSGKLSEVRSAEIPPTVYSLCLDSDDILWVGSIRGLMKYDVITGKTKNYGVLKRETGIIDPCVYRIYRTSNGDLFASTTLGVFRYDCDNDCFREIVTFGGVYATDFKEDKAGRLWITTYASGVFVWDYLSGTAPIHYSQDDASGLPINKLESAVVDGAGRMWVFGFNYGASVFDYDKCCFQNYDTNNTPAFPSDVFYRAELADDMLWISSDAGMLRFNPDTKEVSTFGQKDGLLDVKFTNSSCSTPDGTIIFGADNGIIIFSPSEMTTVEDHPSVVLTEFRVNDEKREFGRNIDLENNITLNYKETTISFSFSIDDISSTSSSRVQCMLEGKDSDWMDISASSTATYHGLRPGKYRLFLRSTYVCGEWMECHKPIDIEIRPFFLFTPLGTISILLFLVVMGGAMLALGSAREKKKKAVEEEAYRRAKDEETFQEKLNFFSHVIHEIKTPLTLITTPLGNIMSKEVEDTEIRHDLGVMRSSTEYLSKLVNELLDFVRVEKSGYVLHPERIDIVSRLNTLIYDFNDTAKNNNRKLTFASTVSNAIVNADSGALDKILNNLLMNAVKYSETFIKISLSIDCECVIVRCVNDGPLIPDEIREDIFKPFIQYRDGASNKKVPGVGLGLPLSRTLAQMMSGSLSYENFLSTNCFVLSLPLVRASSEIEIISEDPLPSDGNLNTILIADDNVDLREYIASKLSDKYNVIQSGGGKEALESIRILNVSLIISDISMPGMTGLELCQVVREDVEISHIPIIIISARGSVQSKIEAMEAGADLFIEKPFDLEYLKSSISNILGRRNLMQSAIENGLLISESMDKFGLPKKDEQFFKSFDALVKENLQNDALNVEWLAERLAMSSSTLTRKLRRLLNTSPNNYITSTRLSVAAQMLSSPSGNNISDICYAVGFSNLSYFSKCFKERYGVSPGSYMSKNR